MSLATFHDSTIQAIERGFASDTPTLIAALPAMGKSTGVIEWAAEHQKPVTIFAPRHDLYDDYIDWAEDAGLETFRLASFHYDCDTVREYSEEERREETEEETEARRDAREAMIDVYSRGQSGAYIHRHANSWGLNPPCQQDGPCPFMKKWEKQNAEGEYEDTGLSPYDVVVGHYTHALVADSEWIVDRYVAIDEFPEEGFIQEYSVRVVNDAAAAYINNHPELPGPSWKLLTNGHASEEIRNEVATYLRRNTRELRDGSSAAFKIPESHADAPLLMYAPLKAERVKYESGEKDENWEFAEISPRKRVVIGPKDEQYVLGIPDFAGALGVVALDGTPTESKWKLLLGEDLQVEYVRREEWSTYLQDSLNLKLYQTTDDVKPYMSTEGLYLTTEKDLVLLEEIRDREGHRPALITSKTALAEYESRLSEVGSSLSELISASGYYNNLKGTNEFKSARLGVVIGSRHLGDGHLKKWAAFMNEAIGREVGEDGRISRGSDLRYTGRGDELLEGMRENETLQAVMRFGRDGNGATVYIHTGALPDWVECEQLNFEIKTWDRGKQKGRQEVVDAIPHYPDWRSAEWTTSELTDLVIERNAYTGEQDPDTVRHRVQDNLKKLKADGLISSRQRVPRGTHYWSNENLHCAGKFGYVVERDRGT
ncbi:hypothetical protein PN419_09855 [Halorubrum ezzemoulense]|uniref:hypothetical protein n=1 Tax=Halorubrum ezzemoulense TaxID=337243 RepID=UPI00233127B2|nr:hypothetical protein [Halorubrum ezzemoulense]MDB9249297.1 hypothetical protein [Halorubrum ezzemoulense]MDB9259547.1 hypothetical protein [Halorubrum ezzemoulense]MDB9263013.1 hypothetical protein [Halorubrum ezzemoulense]MDB9266557.1 hypothetical protein [Halorubrum ezzemoulense]MDB9269908.1 hypothetical protein [Halorubrum ezzemoulense]